MDTILNQILLHYGLPFAVVSLAVYYIVRKMIDRSVDSDVERLKDELRGKTDAEISRLQSILSESAKIKEIRFATFRDKQVEVITVLYEKISRVSIVASDIVTSIDFEPEKYDERDGELREYLEDFKHYYYSKKIYIPNAICRTIDSFFHHVLMGTALRRFTESKKQEKDSPAKEHLVTIEKAIPGIKIELDEQLRKILGGE